MVVATLGEVQLKTKQTYQPRKSLHKCSRERKNFITEQALSQ